MLVGGQFGVARYSGLCLIYDPTGYRHSWKARVGRFKLSGAYRRCSTWSNSTSNTLTTQSLICWIPDHQTRSTIALWRNQGLHCYIRSYHSIESHNCGWFNWNEEVKRTEKVRPNRLLRWLIYKKISSSKSDRRGWEQSSRTEWKVTMSCLSRSQKQGMNSPNSCWNLR